MKVFFEPTIKNQPCGLVTRIKFFLSNSKLKLKTLLEKDLFVKNAGLSKKEQLFARKYPNTIGTKEDYIEGTKNVLQKRLYYPEDVKKMASMTEDEKAAYKRFLDEQEKYYYDSNYDPNTPLIRNYFEKHGIDINKFVIKDKK